MLDDQWSRRRPLPLAADAVARLCHYQVFPSEHSIRRFFRWHSIIAARCHVREHGHLQNHELVFVHEGFGTVTIDDVTSPLEPGSTVLFCRNSRHRIDNTGQGDMKLFWVFMPPGLEDWFNAIGRPRRAGESMPGPFERPADVTSILERMRFMPPRA